MATIDGRHHVKRVSYPNNVYELCSERSRCKASQKYRDLPKTVFGNISALFWAVIVVLITKFWSVI